MARAVRDLMTTRVLTVGPTAPVGQAVELMRRYGFSAVPVVDGRRRVVGIISLLDVIRFRELHPDSVGETVTVEHVMNPDVVTMPPTTSPVAVAHRMRIYGQLRVIPIVERGSLVGVVTRSDLLRPRPPSGPRGWLRRLTGAGEAADVAHELARPGPAGPVPPGGAPVSAAMTARVVTAAPGDPLSTTVRVLTGHRFTALPVVDGDGRLVGIVSEADVLGARGRAASVRDVMTRTPITVPVGATVAQAREIVADRGVRVLPVVDGERLVGVLSRSDLVH